MIVIDRPTLREATRWDAEGIRDLLANIGLGTQHLLAAKTRYWLAEDDQGAVVGTVGLELGERAALLRSAAVHAQWRGFGLGSLLARRAIVAARSLGMSRVYLFSTDAGAFWMRQGFCEVSVDELVTALPTVPQVQLYERKGWLPNETAWRIDI